MKKFLVPILFLFICSCSSSNYVRTAHNKEFDSKKVDKYMLMGLDAKLDKSGLLEKSKPGDRPSSEIEKEFIDQLEENLSVEKINLEVLESISYRKDEALNQRIDDFHAQHQDSKSKEESFPNFQLSEEILKDYKGSKSQFGIHIRIWHQNERSYSEYGSFTYRYTGLSAVIIDLNKNIIVWSTSFSEQMHGSEEEIISLIKSLIVDLKYRIEIPASELRFEPVEHLVRVSFNDESKPSIFGYVTALENFNFIFKDRLDNLSKIHLTDIKKIESLRQNRTLFSGN